MTPHAGDRSNGYEEFADHFMASRNRRIGVSAVLDWSSTLPARGAVLDVGCGNGLPISQALIEAGFSVFGIDASATMIAAFRQQFPTAQAEHSSVQDSTLFNRTFDGIVAWGLIFLLPLDVQPGVIRKLAGALNDGGKLLFTAPAETVTWRDVLTDRECFSLGAKKYYELLRDLGLTIDAGCTDEGDNYYLSGIKDSPADVIFARQPSIAADRLPD